MGQPLLFEALAQPATSILAVTFCAIWYLLHRHGKGYPEVGMSYDSVVQGRELWRCATSQLSHVDLLHLVFNISALWSIGLVERATAVGLGTPYYLQYSALLFLLSPAICMGLYYLLIHVAKREEYRSVTAVGYSCVLFGWMTILAVRQPGGITMLPIFGLANIPMYLAPFGSLIITSLLIPKASFLGHLAGILAGYLIATGVFDPLGPTGAGLLLLTALGGAAWVASQQGQLHMPYLRLPGSPVDNGDVESGSGGAGQLRIVNGVITRR